mmetsp:Transcript_58/g.116  ORF Transcript_58/g.116 Transcript_58/m.116 type:complete len:323 (-) Transcript_58:1014-1982(-)
MMRGVVRPLAAMMMLGLWLATKSRRRPGAVPAAWDASTASRSRRLFSFTGARAVEDGRGDRLDQTTASLEGGAEKQGGPKVLQESGVYAGASAAHSGPRRRKTQPARNDNYGQRSHHRSDITDADLGSEWRTSSAGNRRRGKSRHPDGDSSSIRWHDSYSVQPARSLPHEPVSVQEQNNRHGSDRRQADIGSEWRVSRAEVQRLRTQRPPAPEGAIHRNSSRLQHVQSGSNESTQPAQQGVPVRDRPDRSKTRHRPRALVSPSKPIRIQKLPDSSWARPGSRAAVPYLAAISFHSISDCPQYYLLGAQKCGTSTFYKLLTQR